MKIIKASEKDSPELIAELFNTARTPMDFMATDEAISGEQISKIISNPNIALFLSVNDDGIYQGYCYVFKRKSPEFAHRAFIQAIMVAAPVRGEGIGSELLKTAIDWAKQNGATILTLDVVAENKPAIQLYESLGMKETGRIRNGFHKDGVAYDVATYSVDLV